MVSLSWHLHWKVRKMVYLMSTGNAGISCQFLAGTKFITQSSRSPSISSIEYSGEAMSEHQKITGDQEEQWVLDVVSNVRNTHPLIDSNVLTTFEELLQINLSDRELTPANLKEVATTLIEEFVLKTTESETKNED